MGIAVHNYECFFTGGDSTLQLEAAFCIANAAIWEDETKTVSQLASVTGAYLVTLLGSGNSSLQEACCWGIHFGCCCSPIPFI